MSSSDESSSEDENWAALQSVAVSGLELVSQSQDIADKVSSISYGTKSHYTSDAEIAPCASCHHACSMHRP